MPDRRCPCAVTNLTLFIVGALIAGLGFIGPATAQSAFDVPPPPRDRPEADDAAPQVPLPRPAPDRSALAPERDDSDPSPVAAASSDAEPRIYQTACPAVLSGRVVAEILPPIREGQCRIRSPYLITAVNIAGREVALSQPVTGSCQLATALADWIGEVDTFSIAAVDASLAGVSTGTSFMCRTRNNAPGADVSEHGFGTGLDITGFALSDGSSASLPADWTGGSNGARLMRFSRDAACGRFTTVLSPDSNALHADHLHVDLGCHGGRCTAQICE